VLEKNTRGEKTPLTLKKEVAIDVVNELEKDELQ